MKIHVNTDKHIQGDMQQHVEEAVHAALDRFSGQLSRVEVHLRDLNGGKTGANDKHCLMEARIDGRPPLAASEDADSVAGAINGAARKLQRVLDSSLGKLA